MGEEEKKQFLLKQADMYLSGMSYRQIAKEVGQSYVTVRDNITTKMKSFDSDKYDEVLKKIDDNKEKTVDDSAVRERILEAYKLLTEEDKTIAEIASALKTTEFTIYRDLTKRLKSLNEKAPEIITDSMMTRVVEVLKRHSMDNLAEKSKVSYSEYLFKLFPTERRRKEFLTKCILTFGLRLETLSITLEMNKEDLARELLYKSNPLYDRLYMVINHTIKRQDIARQNFENFLKRLIIASTTKSREKIEKVLSEISDEKVNELLKRKNADSEKFSDEDILTILRFQLKYMLMTGQIIDMFRISKNQYTRRVRNFEQVYPDLVADFNYLSDYHRTMHIFSERRGR